MLFEQKATVKRYESVIAILQFLPVFIAVTNTGAVPAIAIPTFFGLDGLDQVTVNGT